MLSSLALAMSILLYMVCSGCINPVIFAQLSSGHVNPVIIAQLSSGYVNPVIYGLFWLCQSCYICSALLCLCQSCYICSAQLWLCQSCYICSAQLWLCQSFWYLVCGHLYSFNSFIAEIDFWCQILTLNVDYRLKWLSLKHNYIFYTNTMHSIKCSHTHDISHS